MYDLWKRQSDIHVSLLAQLELLEHQRATLIEMSQANNTNGASDEGELEPSLTELDEKISEMRQQIKLRWHSVEKLKSDLDQGTLSCVLS